MGGAGLRGAHTERRCAGVVDGAGLAGGEMSEDPLDDLGSVDARDDAQRANRTITALLAGSANPNAKQDDGLTPLHLAAIEGTREAVSARVAGGADPNARDGYGDTPLYYADRNHNNEASAALKAAGARGYGDAKRIPRVIPPKIRFRE